MKLNPKWNESLAVLNHLIFDSLNHKSFLALVEMKQEMICVLNLVEFDSELIPLMNHSKRI